MDGLIPTFCIYAGLTHFVADFISHWKKKKRWFFFIHCIIYTLLFIPVFLWLNVGFGWLLPIFISHVIIDSQWKFIGKTVRAVLKEESDEDTPFKTIALGIDQGLHLLVILTMAPFIW